ncbi:lysophospholipid acyltransferase family protein [Limosilactobacillus fastidiosus]|uniref:1-acyl-sn-glycerol-3-phosphate acyltransferase n=1 Tax=Limosilactobacillus fastidiosus TaxID=2759855 RepID=A0A7W3U0F8_9LACO|nr:1-acyl-sn-glycerol-3-phosphate acyltransferase [Limosilactobacillus fastidiosus]MBB1062283.1 1-acyl-sn-glycerol-3-phosphate acyltransferase [Limosilactobacillus fastidiosus]MBB1086649.1 1-acyl-sn-glycerol-3-phosphate acyltransferase [Limosilactobacillus fastidiosus]MCD7083360.1 1-acyl-sn-glycerol-3-phosphate acyltransferase [Limosilactobacillus fastidiosus]MCD7086373.1 1-acyl-sn-glycerol-3-phosphate acyltransferase [Limosilactobacillus fastidiosus]MCD7115332.1 1-acyl-sn-glycerol-3-phosphate
MLYSFLVAIVQPFLNLINGKAKIYNKENIPDGNYIIIAPHRTWMDPVLIALAIYPKKFSFMAKKEIFENPLAAFFLKRLHAFPVDRKNPGPSVIKKPVQILRKTDLSTIIFPSGSRYSSKLKGGATLIAKLANVPLVPVVYQGPLKFGEMFKRQPRHIAFGKPIYVDRKNKLDEASQAKLEDEMQKSFDELDHQINPNYKYIVPPKPKDDDF